MFFCEVVLGLSRCVLGFKEEEFVGKRYDCFDYVVIIRIRRCGWKCIFLDRNYSLF